MTDQANQGVRPHVNPNKSSPAYRIQDSLRMNPQTLHLTKVDEDPQGFIDNVFKVEDATGVTSRDKLEIASYQFKDVVQVYLEQWRYEIALREGPVDWGAFETTFLESFSH